MQQIPSEEIDRVAFNALIAKLGETRPDPRDCLRRIVKAYGLDFAQRHAQHAEEVQAQGGMPLPDGSGMRTLGGVFFALVRETLGHETFLKVMLTARKRDFLRREKAEQRARDAAVGEHVVAPVTR